MVKESFEKSPNVYTNALASSIRTCIKSFTITN